MASVVVSAQYELPHHIWVEPSVLDASFDTFIGPVRATIYTPRRTEPTGVTIHPDLVDVPDDAWPDEDRWTTNYATFARAPMTALQRIGLELREDGRAIPQQPHHVNQPNYVAIRDVAADCMEQWFLRVADWVSVVTGQDIDHRHPVYDATTIGAGLQVWGHDSWETCGLRIMTPSPTALSLDDFQAIMGRVAELVEPPVEAQLPRDSIAAHRRHDLRKAVLDAATAVEVCLIRRISAAEIALGENCPGRGLGSRSRWLAARDPGYREPDGLTELADLRNEVIHAGASPTDSWGVGAMVQTAIDFGEAYGRPRDPRAVSTL